MGGVDAICLLNYQWSPTGAIQPTGSINPDPAPGPTVWFPLHVAEDAFSTNSIIDLHNTVDAQTGIPAGKYGHLTRVQDHFEFSGRLGTPVKFWGSDAAMPAYTSHRLRHLQSAGALLRQARHQHRAHADDVRRRSASRMIASALDVYDQWFKALKDNGVYQDWSVFYPD